MHSPGSVPFAELPPQPVVIVDDDPDALLLSRRALIKAGIKNPILTAPGGQEAIDLLRATCPASGGGKGHKPVVVFLDVRMPKVDGFTVLKWLRRRPAFQKTKVFMLTTSDLPIDMSRAIELGADGFLTKYPQAGLLRAMVSTATSLLIEDSPTP